MKFLGLFSKNKKETKKNHQTKVSKTLVIDSKYGTAHWPDRDYMNFSKESYMKNVISFRCIFYIASSLASVDWGLYKKSDTERIQITDHPIVNILKRANPDTSFTFLMQRLISFFLITGNAYIERVTVANGEIRELYALRPDKITIKTNKDTGVIAEYVYDQKLNFPVDPITKKSDILQIKSFHPLDDFYGLSITEPISREIDSSNEATEWQKKVFENEGRPGMAVFVHGFLTDAQWDRLEKQLNDKYRGSKNAGKTIVIEGESTGDMKPYSWTPKEMDWIESNRELSRKICNGYGVPPMLLGIPGDNTYCLPYKTRISTPDGYKYIGDLNKGDNVYSLNKKGKLIKNKIKWQGKVGTKKIYKIKTRNKTIEATENHPILIRKERLVNAPMFNNRMSKEKEYYLEYIQVKDLKIGDIVTQCKKIPYDIEDKDITEKEMELLGYYLGDGYKSDPVYISDNKGYKRGGVIYLAIQEGCEYEEYYKNIADEIIGITGIRRNRAISYGSTNYCKRINELGLYGTAHEKRIPDWIFKLPKNKKLAFLRGIIDSDGSINHQGRCQFVLCNLELIKDIRYLCLQLGLQVNNIRKQEYISLLPNGKKINATSYTFLVTSAKDVNEIKSHTFSYIEKINKNLKKQKKEYLLSTGGKNSIDKIKNLIDIEYMEFSTINCIEELDETDVYDIEVENNHNFIAEGIIVHNSNMKEARAGFWEETIIYYLNLFKGEINNWIFETDEIFIDYDLSKIPALEYKKELMWKRVENADFLTIDEKREMVGKEKLPNGMGNVILVNMGSTTLDQLLADNEELDSMLDGEEQQDEEDKEIQKLVDEGYSDDMARIIVGERYE
jgi:HK97 family phage portal protein